MQRIEYSCLGQCVCVHIDIDVDAMYLDGLKETRNSENRTKHKEDVEGR